MFFSLPNSISSSPTILPANSRRDSTKNYQNDFPPYRMFRAKSDTSSKMSENSENSKNFEFFEPPAPPTITRWDKSCRLNNVLMVQIEDPTKELTEPTYFDSCLDPFSDDSRPVSRTSSIQVYNGLSFEDKWKIIFDVENGWDFIGIGSQLNAAYVSPARNGRRVRTSCDSHLDPGQWCVDPDGFINEAGRAGGPSLCPRPYESCRKPHDRHPFYTVMESYQFITLVVFTMAKYNIRPTSMKFLSYSWAANKYFPTTPCLVFEASRSTVDDSWVEACREIWKWVYDHCDVKKDHHGFSVEIFDPELRGYPRFVPCLPEGCNFPLPAELFDEIKGAIDTRDVIKWDLLPLQHSAHEKSAMTLYMKVKYRSDRDWRIPREQMVAVLDKWNLPGIAILISKAQEWGTHAGLFASPLGNTPPALENVLAQAVPVPQPLQAR